MADEVGIGEGDDVPEEDDGDETLEDLLRRTIRFMRGILLFSIAGFVAAFICIIALGVVVWTIHDDDKDDEHADCLVRQEGRDGVRAGIIEGGVASARTLIRVAGSGDDPRAEELIRQTREDLVILLDELLPPVECE